MAEIHGSFKSLDKGIINISKAADVAKLKLPDLQMFQPSEAKMEAMLPKMWEAKSLENTLLKSLLPKIKDLENLNPTVYAKSLKDAKKVFEKMREEEKKNKKEKKNEFEQDDEEVLNEVIKDFEEIESYKDLLWMLRQMVHIA